MRWRVAISHLVGDTRLMEELLRAVGVSIIEETNETFLVGEPLEAEDVPGSVLEVAKRLKLIISDLEHDDPALICGFDIGLVLERRVDGSWAKHHFAALQAGVLACATMSATVSVSATNQLSQEEQIRRDREEKEREFQDRCRRTTPRFVAAFRYPRALQVQQLLRGTPDPLTLGHIAEIIEDDIGGAIKTLVTENQWTRFQRSINHPDVFGVRARHIISTHEPPPKPMHLDEARAFIRGLADRWMLHKLGNESDA